MVRDKSRMWELESSLYIEGKAEGRAETGREWCAMLAQKHHPAVFERVEGVIAKCDDADRLKEWILVASDLSDAEFVALLGA